MTSRPTPISSATYVGVFLLTAATLVYQMLLTRIFNVTMWYHFAFMAISIAMFGMTVGALIVYLKPRWFPVEKACWQMGWCALGFAVSAVLCFIFHLNIPFVGKMSMEGFISIASTYTLISIPFLFDGILVAIALTRFPERVSRLYGADLLGAGLGCLLIVWILEWTDAPTAIFLAAGMAALAAVAFARDAASKTLGAISILMVAGFAVYTVVGTHYYHDQKPLLRARYVKGAVDTDVYKEYWSAYSNIRVYGDPEAPRPGAGWGLSRTYHGENPTPQLDMVLNAAASTIITKWDGETTNTLAFLGLDVVNLGYHLRPDAEALVVGVGGGRDLLAAIQLNAKSVLGVEINHQIIDVLRTTFYDYTGRLTDHPKVRIEVDEARSYIARTDERFDVLQISLIDTWAATAAGAFVLSENSLYTEEAWGLFFDRLKPGGLITCSRWFHTKQPAESWRTVALAVEALKRRGVENPRRHILAAATPFFLNGKVVDAEAWTINLLASRDPFTDEDVRRFEQLCAEREFVVILSPTVAYDEVFAGLMEPGDLSPLYASLAMNIEPPTDDNAFFFHMIRFRDLFDRDQQRLGTLAFNNQALMVLGLLLITVSVLTLLCIVGPLLLTLRRGMLSGATPHFLYFGGIGLGFMIIEISQLQRLNIFLGHPVYSLVVVLFSLLLSSGIGSFLTSSITQKNLLRAGTTRLLILLGCLVLFGLLTPPIIHAFEGSATPIRLLLATLLIVPIGIPMGMAFPMGMKMAAACGKQDLAAWLWGINGATGVLASVLTIAVAIFSGVSTAFWTGVIAYAIVLIAFRVAGRQQASQA